jgi:hypothetical protein
MSDTPAQGTGLAGATQAFEAFLAGPAGNETPKSATDASNTAPAPDEVEAFGDADGDETVSDTSPETDENAPADEAADDEDGSDTDEPQVQLVTVKIDGKEEQIPLDEAVKGYQRQSDYSRKTAALAEERRSFDGERQAVFQERQQYAQLLNGLQQQLQEAQPQEPDWQRLYETDPVEWVRQREVWRDRQEKLAAAQFESQRVQALTMQEQQQRLAHIVQEGRHKLTELVPSWRDNAKWESDRVKLLDYGQKLGFQPQELQQAYDPRAIVALYKAMQFDTLMAKRPQAAPPKGPKSAPAGNAATSPRPASDVARAKQRLAQTGRIGDAASIFEKMLG